MNVKSAVAKVSGAAIGLSFVLGDRVVSKEELLSAPAPKVAKAPRMSRAKSRDEATHSNGFQVVGYPPATWNALPDLYSDAVKANERDAVENKHPGTMDEFIARFVSKNKPKRVRSKPYELEDAASICAAMASKAGWARVDIVEVLKREA